ncbi:unnamed protein product [Protopolystoma xenopodis]|uniref:Uncharacterized protein n=1 Tax=Protopolystoma xenopodis TaxID=117903 RepID=A0A3S4ZZR5_9PLAT|nr:unnamed protein product [Protopolystoma xenopodis]
MDTGRSDLGERFAITGHTIDRNATGMLTSYGENTRKRKIREAVDIIFQRNLMNRRLKKARVSDTFAYCLRRHKKKTLEPRTTVQQDEETASRCGA